MTNLDKSRICNIIEILIKHSILKIKRKQQSQKQTNKKDGFTTDFL